MTNILMVYRVSEITPSSSYIMAEFAEHVKQSWPFLVEYDIKANGTIWIFSSYRDIYDLNCAFCRKFPQMDLLGLISCKEQKIEWIEAQ